MATWSHPAATMALSGSSPLVRAALSAGGLASRGVLASLGHAANPATRRDQILQIRSSSTDVGAGPAELFVLAIPSSPPQHVRPEHASVTARLGSRVRLAGMGWLRRSLSSGGPTNGESPDRLSDQGEPPRPACGSAPPNSTPRHGGPLPRKAHASGGGARLSHCIPADCTAVYQ